MRFFVVMLWAASLVCGGLISESAAETVILPNQHLSSGVVLGSQYSGNPDEPRVYRAADLHGFRVSNSRGHAVVVKADHIVLDGWHISGAGDDGIKVYGKNVTIRNCRIEQTEDQGIACHGGLGLTVEQCELLRCGTSTKDHGIYLSGSEHRIVNNSIVEAAGYGLHFYQEPTAIGGIDRSLVQGNRISASRTNRGIVWLSNGHNILRNNIVRDAGRPLNSLRTAPTDIIDGNSWQ